ncbi:sensor histidine kinase [Nocardia sp. KC 131]|uniref:sensor histidine kinase n=1 Tax=Nocardia arseniciresistens TaxID=3392119 RepID=UPI00398ED7C4
MMSLARRLSLALVALVLTLLAAGAAVVLIQRHYLVQQLDLQLTKLSNMPMPGLMAAQHPFRPARSTLAFGDIYLGIRNADGTLTTVQAPTNDAALVPDLNGVDELPTPTGRPTTSGNVSEVRAVTVRKGGTDVVIALSAQSAQDATKQLITTLAAAGLVLAIVVGSVVWWVHRLGLTPIARMTEAADAIAAGASHRRIEGCASGTEADRLGKALNTMIDTTQATEDRMRRFVADASHELRTPLTTLRGYSALHSSGTRTDDVHDAMRRINDEAQRMSRIVEALLDLNNLDVHGLTDRERVDVVAVIDAVVEDLHVIAPERRIEVDTPRSLFADAVPDRVTQAILSLTTNALRHTPHDTPITIRVTNATGVRISVIDHGPGIPPEHLPHLFDRFYRVDSGRSRSEGGNGLGLAIVAAIMQAHNGDYGVDSQPGIDSTFWIEFPEYTPAQKNR